LVLDEVGIMLTGPSGAGKSLLALELMEMTQLAGKQAALIADDRLEITIEDGRIIAHAPPEIGGMIELRGRGIIERPHMPSAKIDLVVDLVDKMDRLVEEDELVTEIEGISIARCPLPNRSLIDSAHQRMLVGEAIAALDLDEV
jgi:HPr kinase/phosphorylase